MRMSFLGWQQPVLFWIAWRMYGDLRRVEASDKPDAASTDAKPVTFGRALVSIIAANIALSLDNVLAVAGVARHAPAIMVFGLVLSVVLMGAAATLIASFIEKHRWLTYIGIAALALGYASGALPSWPRGSRGVRA